MTKTEQYLALVLEIHARPRQYRAGLEHRLSRLWRGMTVAERVATLRAWS